MDNNPPSRKRKEKKIEITRRMGNLQNTLSKQNEYEKFEVKEKMKQSKPLFKYVKSKTKIYENVSTINKKMGELMDTAAEPAGV